MWRGTFPCSSLYDSQSGLLALKETVSVYEVSKGSLADGVLKSGDVLVSATFGEKTVEITRQHHIIDMMLDIRVGDTVSFKILRDGVEKIVNITITKDCLTAY